MRNTFLTIFLLVAALSVGAQSGSRWQQHVDYTMEIDMNVENFQFDGEQTLVYTNNSPDELKEVFYHLQYNAFQPGSEMDIRLQHVPDPHPRMSDNVGTREEPQFESRIAKLKPEEIGFQKVLELQQDGKPVEYEIFGSVMKVKLNTPIQPKGSTTFFMKFKGQVPVHIRRAGRNNAEGVALSMAQWYPKLAEYDEEGWHANAYLSREFYGVWGNFDVTIHIDRDYTVGGTGYLQNPQEVGHGYEDPDKPLKLPKGKKLTWHFKAPNVHDFTWAADPEYIHDKVMGENGVELHFFYKEDPKYKENWKNLQPKTQEILAYFNEHIGPYPYKQYSVIQAGDGGMEYGMCTFITGDRSFGSLVGVTAHEFAHSWFQFILATNETKHAWMDEGFTSYISDHCENVIFDQKKDVPNDGAYSRYIQLANSNIQEPLGTFSDRYESNTVYGISAYNKGSVFLSQLGYIIGKENLDKTIRAYYDEFKFTHPTPNDFKRVAEKISGIQLEWYLNYWTQTTKVIDYGVEDINGNVVTLKRVGTLPMPIDARVTYTDGSTEDFYIPLQMMYGSKPTEATVRESWSWVAPTYELKTSKPVQSVEIDPSQLMADVDKSNNTMIKQKS